MGLESGEACQRVITLTAAAGLKRGGGGGGRRHGSSRITPGTNSTPLPPWPWGPPALQLSLGRPPSPLIGRAPTLCRRRAAAGLVRNGAVTGAVVVAVLFATVLLEDPKALALSAVGARGPPCLASGPHHWLLPHKKGPTPGAIITAAGAADTPSAIPIEMGIHPGVLVPFAAAPTLGTGAVVGVHATPGVARPSLTLLPAALAALLGPCAPPRLLVHLPA